MFIHTYIHSFIRAKSGVKPVTIKMIDAKTKEHVETLEVDACLVATGTLSYHIHFSTLTYIT